MSEIKTEGMNEDLRAAYEEAEAKRVELREKELADREHEFENEMMRLQGQTADVMGALDAVIRTAETPEVKVQALGQKLRHLELRRHHVAQVAQEERIRTQMAWTLDGAVQDFNEWLKSQRENAHNPDHTLIKFRGMGLQIQASGREDDPLFQKLALTIEEISKDIKDARADLMERAQIEDERDRAFMRDKEKHLSGMPDKQ